MVQVRCEGPELCRCARLGAQQIDAALCLRAEAIQQQFLQPPRPDILADRPVRHQGDAQPLQYRQPPCIAIVALHREQRLRGVGGFQEFAPAAHARAVAPVDKAVAR
ncbi:hypothetical protein D3C81_1413840 [compost metagenome]